MIIGVRGHDLPANTPEELCEQMQALGITHVQLAMNKSFPMFKNTLAEVSQIAEVLKRENICVAVLGCYVDPCTQQGQERFLRHLEYSKILGASVVGTETAASFCPENLTLDRFNRVTEAFCKFAEKAKELDVCFAAEAVKGFPVGSVETTVKLLETVNSPHLKIIFDAANIFKDINKETQNDIYKQAFDAYGDKICAFHIKDNKNIDYQPVLSFVKQHQSIPIITEEICGERLKYFQRFGL